MVVDDRSVEGAIIKQGVGAIDGGDGVPHDESRTTFNHVIRESSKGTRTVWQPSVVTMNHDATDGT